MEGACCYPQNLSPHSGGNYLKISKTKQNKYTFLSVPSTGHCVKSCTAITTIPRMRCWYFGRSIRTGRSLKDSLITSLVYCCYLIFKSIRRPFPNFRDYQIQLCVVPETMELERGTTSLQLLTASNMPASTTQWHPRAPHEKENQMQRRSVQVSPCTHLSAAQSERREEPRPPQRSDTRMQGVTVCCLMVG